MAVSRLKNTEKKLLRTGEVYKTIICVYQEKGYIRKVEDHPREKELVDGVWYLPHSPVCRPDKSTTKTIFFFKRAPNLMERLLITRFIQVLNSKIACLMC